MQKTGRAGLSRLTARKNRVGYLFLLPFLFGSFVIFIPALIESLYYSFSTVAIRFDSLDIRWVGWQNYIALFTEDTEFRVMLLSAMRGMLTDLLVIILFSFFLATILNQKFKGRGLVRMIFFLPVLLSTGIISATDTNNLAMTIFNSSGNTAVSQGIAAGGFSVLAQVKQLLLRQNVSSTAVSFIIGTVDNTYSILNYSGVQILIFLSALQSISPSVFESARVEGATKWEEFWKITFPMLTPMILVNTVYTFVDQFTNPKYGILDYIQEKAFSDANAGLGFSSAVSWVYFLVNMILLGLICGVIAPAKQDRRGRRAAPHAAVPIRRPPAHRHLLDVAALEGCALCASGRSVLYHPLSVFYQDRKCLQEPERFSGSDRPLYSQGGDAG